MITLDFPDDSSHLFRLIPAGYSDRNRPPIALPDDSCRLFRFITATRADPGGGDISFSPKHEP